jgi:hypothetical protein
MGLHSNGTLFALATNVRLEWKWQEYSSTLAYYIIATITAIKSFIVLDPGLKKLFTPVI